MIGIEFSVPQMLPHAPDYRPYPDLGVVSAYTAYSVCVCVCVCVCAYSVCVSVYIHY